MPDVYLGRPAGRPFGRSVALVARSTSLLRPRLTPAFVLARVFPANGARTAAYVRFRLSSNWQSAPTAWLLLWPSGTAVDDLPDTRDQMFWMRPRRLAATPACPRELTPSFRRIADTWWSTVFSDTTRRWAI